MALLMTFGFSGYLLPWNQIAYFATKVGTDVAASTPLIGEMLGRILRGGEDVGAATLTRFFALHVMVLPLATVGLIVFHILLVQKNGMSTPPKLDENTVKRMPFFPNFFLRELMVWYGTLAVLGALAAIFPWELGEKADPFSSAPAGIRPEWYFLAEFYTLKLIPGHVGPIEGELLGLLGFALLGVGWALLPVWGVTKSGQAKTRLTSGAAIFLIVYLIVFSILAYYKLGYYK
jgi:cytochrome b6